MNESKPGSEPKGYADLQYQIYADGLTGHTPALPILLEEFERLAKEKLDARDYGYVAGGAGDTPQSNVQAFARYRLVPRMLRDVSARDYSVQIAESQLRQPLMLAPIGVHQLMHPEAESATARAAAAQGIGYVHSMAASRSLEEVAQVLGNTPRWFQLYWPNDDEFTKSLLKRAQAAGYSAIVVTLDTRLLGWRPHDLVHAYLPFLRGVGLANYFSDPVFRSRLALPPEEDSAAAVALFGKLYSDLSHTWNEIAFLRKHTKLPLLLKGILHLDDAKKARMAGVDGIIVSNHGGRQVGGAIAALDALATITDALSDKIDILFDGGVRSGADMAKALALGAKAVLLGRPFMWGLAVAGEAGVRAVIQRVLAEFELTAALCGCARAAELKPEIIQRNA